MPGVRGQSPAISDQHKIYPEHDFIGHRRGYLRHVPYLVALLPKAFHDTAVNPLVSYKLHVAVPAVG